ncbi:hypothetical protein K503DRAFT_776452 [Rhizopogon vinicolor AM-OR11-026]|uniref:Uncharacterized protein n=1 Tax=Rhizopogon vinicolor AM-OR11-026 TaxID=1314800 RepID=A0A1B7MJ90_9AGAM|nr:hypothetical protein K503DRAFT_776452 [Rhizopogon vinicolor AM-OR11-026]
MAFLKMTAAALTVLERNLNGNNYADFDAEETPETEDIEKRSTETFRTFPFVCIIASCLTRNASRRRRLLLKAPKIII